jgi:hypothetical protein
VSGGAERLASRKAWKGRHLEVDADRVRLPNGHVTEPGFTDEKIWLFLGTDLAPARQQLEQDEVLDIERLPLRTAIEKAERGEIHDAKSLAALLLALPHLNRAGA